MAESYISIDLNDPRAKNISEVIGSSTCKKILKLLAEKELTETEISKELKIPLNSVEYNLKKLIQSGLIESTQHWWSIKGKKMPSYRVSDKKIIISPKSITTEAILLVTLVVGTVSSFFVRHLTKPQEVYSLVQDNIAESFLMKTVQPASGIIESTPSFFSSLATWEWLLIGAWFATLLFFILTKFSKGRYK
jgi:DNA-binding transcriptional ArsR family regulator